MSSCVTAPAILIVGPPQAMQAIGGCAIQGQAIDRVDDTFAALERLCGGHTGVVFVWMASLPSRAGSALASIRRMLPAGAKVILLARPDEEPLARNLLSDDVDDYLIWPVQPREVSRVLNPTAARDEAAALEGGSAPAMVLTELVGVLHDADRDLQGSLDRFAAFVCRQLRADGATAELPGARSVGGESAAPAVLSAAIDLGERGKGTLSVAARRSGTYSAGDVAHLEALAASAGVVYRLALEASTWKREALTDPLTGLTNRRGLLRRLPEVLALSRRQRAPVTLLLFDIDDFKHYNDAYSHDAGDEILREAGSLFLKCTRQHDIVARYGGDEFVVVFWEANEPRKAGSKPPRDVPAVLDRFRTSLERHKFKTLGPEAQGKLTISGGLVTFPWDAGTGEELISRADEALLQAKRQGKNRIWLVGQDPQ